MFRENALELEIFDREYLIFFNQKCVLDYTDILKAKKSKKKPFQKVAGSSWIYPAII